jgi:hypothetical protein
MSQSFTCIINLPHFSSHNSNKAYNKQKHPAGKIFTENTYERTDKIMASPKITSYFQQDKQKKYLINIMVIHQPK